MNIYNRVMRAGLFTESDHCVQPKPSYRVLTACTSIIAAHFSPRIARLQTHQLFGLQWHILVQIRLFLRAHSCTKVVLGKLNEAILALVLPSVGCTLDVHRVLHAGHDKPALLVWAFQEARPPALQSIHCHSCMYAQGQHVQRGHS